MQIITCAQVSLSTKAKFFIQQCRAHQERCVPGISTAAIWRLPKLAACPSIQPALSSLTSWPNTGLPAPHKVPNIVQLIIFSPVLEVQAIDQGSPVLSTSVLINVNIEDSNDNAPVFAEGNYTVYVQEDRPYGHVLLRFTVTDSDDSPNGAPFTW